MEHCQALEKSVSRLSVVVLALTASIGCRPPPETDVSLGSPDEAHRSQMIAAAVELAAALKADPGADRARVASALLSLGNVAASNGELETAEKAFGELVADFEDVPRAASAAQYKLAVTYQRYGLEDLAERAYVDLLEKDPAEAALSEGPSQHHVSMVLAEMHLEGGDYRSAQHYFSLSLEKYPFRSFCGNAHSANAIRETVFQSRIHELAGESELAIQALLPYLLTNLVGNNGEIVDRAIELLRKVYSPDELSRIFERSLAGVQPDRKDDHGRFVLDILGVKAKFDCHHFLYRRRDFLGIVRFDVELEHSAKNLRSCLRKKRIFQELL